MIKRSECRCICHTDAVALGQIEGPMHVAPCCEPDEAFLSVGIEPLNETHAQIKTAVAKRNEEEYKRIWNSAIEAAIKMCKDSGNQISAANLMSLKK